MGEDEEGTLAALKTLWRDLSDPKIKEHHGRIVKTTGDGLLVEFASVVDAVRCAVAVQQAMAEQNGPSIERSGQLTAAAQRQSTPRRRNHPASASQAGRASRSKKRYVPLIVMSSNGPV